MRTILERLRGRSAGLVHDADYALLTEAADRIEELERDAARRRVIVAAAEEWADALKAQDGLLGPTVKLATVIHDWQTYQREKALSAPDGKTGEG